MYVHSAAFISSSIRFSQPPTNIDAPVTERQTFFRKPTRLCAILTLRNYQCYSNLFFADTQQLVFWQFLNTQYIVYRFIYDLWVRNSGFTVYAANHIRYMRYPHYLLSFRYVHNPFVQIWLTYSLRCAFGKTYCRRHARSITQTTLPCSRNLHK